MFTYCLNGPINKTDKNGTNPALYYVAKKLIGYVIAYILIYVLICAILYPILHNVTEKAYDGISQGKVKPKAKADSKSKAEEKQKKKKQEYFPLNPLEFNPKGLELKKRVEMGEGKNGGIYHWVLPNTNIVILEWDEDLQKGSHYHAVLPEDYNKHNDIHYEPGSPIPEPWNSLYF